MVFPTGPEDLTTPLIPHAPLNARLRARRQDRRPQCQPRRHTIRSSSLLLFTYVASYSIFARRRRGSYIQRALAPSALLARGERYRRRRAGRAQVLVLGTS